MTKPGFSFLLILQLFIFSITSPSLVAQEWTEPVNISNLGGYSRVPDMVIDHSGVIHVVWSYRIEDWWWKIMYTRSEDDGTTWSVPLDLLQNTDLWMSQPHIDCDSKNHLYVTYDYATGTPDKMVYMIVYDGHQWSDPILVSEEMPGSHYNNVIIDHNDRVYVFWDYSSTSDNHYRYFENNTWSPTYCPYPGNEEFYALMEAEVSEQNSLHWIGASAGIWYYGERAQYFFYEYDLNLWMEPQMPVQDTITVGIDVALNSGELPECVYRTYPSPDDKTKHTQKEQNNWSAPELVAGEEESHQYQQIAVDQNYAVHIVEVQMPDDGLKLVHYRKYGNEWIGQPIDTCFIILFPDLLFHNNKLYVVYNKTWPIAPQTFESDLFLSKYEIVTNINEETHQQPELEIYPNPASGIVSIEFENSKEQHIDLSVFNISGKHIITLINKNIPQGRQQLLWNGTDKNGKEAKSGSYLVRLSCGRNFVTQAVEIIK